MKIKSVKVRETNEYLKPRIYFFIEDESVLENLYNRHSRPYNEYRKLLPKVFKRAKFESDLKARWSQKAGCSCGCSPGFIVDAEAPFYHGKEVFVEIC